VSKSDQRALLWLCCAAICWRWFVGLRAPLPGVDACRDLWLAEQLAAGQFASLVDRAWEPLYGLLLAPALALGATPFAAAQVAACLLGGLALVPIAMAAERLREGAGVPAAAIAMAAAGPVVAAGAGSATSMFVLLSAFSLWAYAARRFVLSVGLLLVVIAGGTDQVASHPIPGFEQLRYGLGASVVLLPLLLLSPRARRFAAPALVLLALLVVAASVDAWTTLLPVHSAVLAVLAGLGLARLPLRVRDLLLALVVAAECHAAWTLGEPEAAVVERILPRYLLSRVHEEGQVVLSTMPRVRWAAGLNPAVAAKSLSQLSGELSGPRASRHVGSIVMTEVEAKDASMRALLASSFERAELPPNLQDLLDAHGLSVLCRRR
jgi:hypothetical protein